MTLVLSVVLALGRCRRHIKCVKLEASLAATFHMGETSEASMSKFSRSDTNQPNIGALIMRIGFWGSHYTTIIIRNPKKRVLANI